MDTVRTYLPDAVWYDYETVSSPQEPLQEPLLLISDMTKQPQSRQNRMLPDQNLTNPEQETG